MFLISIDTSIGGIGERQASQTLSMQLEWQAASRHEYAYAFCKKNNIEFRIKIKYYVSSIAPINHLFVCLIFFLM